jgi:uncharacterized sulfatase
MPGTLTAGVRLKDLVQPHDIAATILAFAGFPKERIQRVMPESMDVTAGLLGKTPDVTAGRDHAVCMYRNSGVGINGYWTPPIRASMFRDERYKLNVYHPLPEDRGPAQGELVDMQFDPGEKHNLWDDESCREIKSLLVEKLMNWMVNTDVDCHGSVGGDSSPWAPQSS